MWDMLRLLATDAANSMTNLSLHRCYIQKQSHFPSTSDAAMWMSNLWPLWSTPAYGGGMVKYPYHWVMLPLSRLGTGPQFMYKLH